jgi:hypothetical protein
MRKKKKRVILHYPAIRRNPIQCAMIAITSNTQNGQPLSPTAYDRPACHSAARLPRCGERAQPARFAIFRAACFKTVPALFLRDKKRLA